MTDDDFLQSARAMARMHGFATATTPQVQTQRYVNNLLATALVVGTSALSYGLTELWPHRPSDVCYGMLPTYFSVLAVTMLVRDWRLGAASFAICWAIAVYSVIMPPTAPVDWAWLGLITLFGVGQIWCLRRLILYPLRPLTPLRCLSLWAQSLQRLAHKRHRAPLFRSPSPGSR